ncbi:CRISPR-associated protein, cas5e-type [Ligilactobacillus equi DSM 15833 = JCM 10991]|nr:CRISPR-associated protein, cas5e-type [Ligilactobacillus equi DSM 15833 = JCM 10991]
MIAASLGYRRDDDAQINELNKLNYAVRIEQLGDVTTDFHIVHYEGYITGNRGQVSGSKITYRDYLQDTVFLVAISSEDDELINTIRHSLAHPKFQLFLGRRASAPAGVLKTSIFPNMTPIQVLENESWQAADWYKKRLRKSEVALKIVADVQLLKGQKYKISRDTVISFSEKKRKHGYRGIATKTVKVANDKYVATSTKHDPLSFFETEVIATK